MDALLQEYDLGQELGRGSFGVVYRAKHRTSGKDVAIKVIDLSDMRQRGLMEKVYSEIKVHRELRHPNIVQCLHCGHDNNHLYMVLELCTQGNLYTYLQRQGRLRETEALQIIHQLVSALSYMHARNVIHRDLKLSNVLVSGDVRAGWAEARVKLCDFGLAVRMEHPDEDNLTMCGTANYMSPEVSKGRPHSFPADIWSVGCLLYTLVVGQPPFHAGHVEDVMHQVRHRDCEIPQGYFSDLTVDLLQTMLRKDPDARPTVEQVLAHPVFSATQTATGSAIATVDTEGSHLDDQQQGAAKEKEAPSCGERQWRIVRSHGAPHHRSPAPTLRDPSSVHSSAALSASAVSAASVEALQAQYDALRLDVATGGSRAAVHQHQHHLQQQQQAAANLDQRQFQYMQHQGGGGNASTVTTSTALVSYPHVSFPVAPSALVPMRTALSNSHVLPAALGAATSMQQAARQLQTIPESSRHAGNLEHRPVSPKHDGGDLAQHRADTSKQLTTHSTHSAAPSLPKPIQSHTEPNIVGRPSKSQIRSPSQHSQQPAVSSQQQPHQLQPQYPKQVEGASPITSMDDARLQLLRSPDASMRSSRSHQPHIPAPGPGASRSYHSADVNTSFLRGPEVGSSFASAATVSTARIQAADGAGAHRQQSQYSSWHKQYAHDRFIGGALATGHKSGSAHRASHSNMLDEVSNPPEQAMENVCADIWRDLVRLPSILLSTIGHDLLVTSTAARDGAPKHRRELVYVTSLTQRHGLTPSKSPATPADAAPKLVRLVLCAAEPGRAVVGQVGAALRGEYEQLLTEAAAAAEGDRNLLVQELQAFPGFSSRSTGDGSSIVSGHSTDRRSGSQHTGSRSAIRSLLRHSAYCSDSLSLFSRQGETRSYDLHQLGGAPPLVVAMLRQVQQLLCAAKSRLPTRVFYFPPDTDSAADPNLRGYKCTFMSNTPFADVYVQWPDGAMLRFETGRGVLHIDLGPAVVPAMKWSGDVSAIGVGTSTSSSFHRGQLQGVIPPYFVPHAKVALRAYAKCCAREAGRSGDASSAPVVTSVIN